MMEYECMAFCLHLYLSVRRFCLCVRLSVAGRPLHWQSSSARERPLCQFQSNRKDNFVCVPSRRRDYLRLEHPLCAVLATHSHRWVYLFFNTRFVNRNRSPLSMAQYVYVCIGLVRIDVDDEVGYSPRKPIDFSENCRRTTAHPNISTLNQFDRLVDAVFFFLFFSSSGRCWCR